MKNETQTTERVSIGSSGLVRRGPWDGPVRTPDRWTKMRGVRKGFKKWTNGESWVTHEAGSDGCHLGRRGEETKFVRMSPWGTMNWVNNHSSPNVQAD